MPRAIWKGAISFGLVTIPVGLYSAVERAEQLHFRLLHAKDESPIDYKRVCEAEGVEVPWPEIVKGYEISKGEFVVMSDKDFARARTETTQTLAIRDFVPAQAIDFLYFDEPYYLAPEGKAATKSYALLRDALARAGRVG
ncbi:MAG TPA: Ku protein, partial [Methylomirabilota bacterium]|nr:Ku protein [Methylomirabilota bacterium]